MANPGGFSLTARDPNKNCQYLQVEFDDIIGEIEGSHSIDCVWKAAYKSFTCTKNCCYRALTLFFAVPISLIVGISFACLLFQHIWCIGPAIRHCRINCYVVKQYMRAILDGCLAPCCSDMGLLCSRIRIQHVSGTDSGTQVETV